MSISLLSGIVTLFLVIGSMFVGLVIGYWLCSRLDKMFKNQPGKRTIKMIGIISFASFVVFAAAIFIYWAYTYAVYMGYIV